MIFKALGFNIFRNIFKKPLSALTKKEQFDKVRKYDTKELIEFLRERKELGLKQEVLDILEKEEFYGANLLRATLENFQSCGLKFGPAERLVHFAEEINRTKKSEELHIIVDNSNFFIEGRNTVGLYEGTKEGQYFPNLHFDYGRLLTTIKGERELGSYPVIVGSRPPPNDSLWRSIQKLGYNVTVHDRNFDNLEKRVDISISISIMNALRFHNPGIIVLVSGDGDFGPTIKESLDAGWMFETWFWRNSTSEFLKSNSHFKPLDDVYKSFAYGYGPDFTKKKYGLKITDDNIVRGIVWNLRPEDIFSCYETLGLFCCFDRPDRNTMCLYFKEMMYLEEAKRWIKIKYPDIRVLDEINKPTE